MPLHEQGLHTLKDAPVFRYGVSPNKLFDYMAAELPVVTNVPGLVSDIVRSADCGVTVRPSDPKAIAEGIRDICFRLKREPKFGKSGRHYIAQHHDRAQLAQKVVEIVTRVRTA